MCTDPRNEREGWLDDAVRELRRPVPGELRSRAAVLARLREDPPRFHGLGRAWEWFVRPRPIPVSPLGGLAGAVAVVAVVALGMRLIAGPAVVSTPIPRTASPTAVTTAGSHTVRFEIVAPEAVSVFVVGDFNNWDPQATPLARSGLDGAWTAVVPLRPGLYQYSFVVDGRIRAADAGAPLAPAGDFGGGSSVILVGGTS